MRTIKNLLHQGDFEFKVNLDSYEERSSDNTFSFPNIT
jgi:hypothetical protein